MDSIIFTRIKNLCTENGITITKLESEIGISQGTILKWKTARSPSVEIVTRVAQYLHTSIDYLVGITDIKSPIDTMLKDRDVVSIQRARENMNEHDKTRMMLMLKLGFEKAFEGNNQLSAEESKLLDR